LERKGSLFGGKLSTVRSLLVIGLLCIHTQTIIQSRAANYVQAIQPTEDKLVILQNPLMGFQDHNVYTNWWPWSTGYLRATSTCSDGPCGPLNWSRINPQPGVFNFNDIDRFIRDMKNQKKFVVFRVRSVVDEYSLPAVPAWARARGVTQSVGNEAFGRRTGIEVDYHRCVFLSLWSDLVQELIRRYDAEPAVVAVDIGTYGWYGEWFSGKTVPRRWQNYQGQDKNDPTLQQSIDTRTRIIRMFTGGSGTGRCLANDGTEQVVSYTYPGFKNKPVLISRGDMEDVLLGTAHGAGIRFDAVGAVGEPQLEFRQQISILVAETWRQRPILGEFATGSGAPLDDQFMIRSVCFAREFHLSGIHNNFRSKPPIDLDPLFRELGYRIILEQASFPPMVSVGSEIQLSLTWVNRGTAPAYQRYPLKLYLKAAGTDHVVAELDLAATDITQILPAEVKSTDANFLDCPTGPPPLYQSTERVRIPDLPLGNYDLYLAFIEPVYGSPIQLALRDRDAAGRYYLGSVTLVPNLYS
jgi:hypothetical protein